MKRKYKLLDVFGIELEYMVVNQDSLDIRPVTDKLFEKVCGKTTNEVVNDRINWSNELVLHVLEFKNKEPEPDLVELVELFQKEVRRANLSLKEMDGRLMPGAMHPWMNPDKETKLWPYENNEIYASYDRIFGCRGHGWSNLQSLHINISFANDEEFRKLHSAIRFLLPLIPALSSSSPIYEGKTGSCKSNRLQFYLQNQRRIPSIIGQAVPEAIRSEGEYQEKILHPMYKDISPSDPDGVLQEEWLNSRGAIPKFERGCIEIRLADVQEAPLVDLSIANFWIKGITKLVKGGWVDIEKTESLSSLDLRQILNVSVKEAENAMIKNNDYLSCFGVKKPLPAKDLLAQIFSDLAYEERENEFQQTIQKLLEIGSLSTRIQNSIGGSTSKSEIQNVYANLCDCLEEGKIFEN